MSDYDKGAHKYYIYMPLGEKPQKVLKYKNHFKGTMHFSCGGEMSLFYQDSLHAEWVD